LKVKRLNMTKIGLNISQSCSYQFSVRQFEVCGHGSTLQYIAMWTAAYCVCIGPMSLFCYLPALSVFYAAYDNDVDLGCVCWIILEILAWFVEFQLNWQ